MTRPKDLEMRKELTKEMTVFLSNGTPALVNEIARNVNSNAITVKSVLLTMHNIQVMTRDKRTYYMLK